MTTSSQRGAATTPASARLAQALARVPQLPSAWLTERREQALQQFSALGFPTTRDEIWRYTNLAALTARELTEPTPAATVDVSALPMLDPNGTRIVLANGRFVAGASQIRRDDGVVVLPLADALLAHPELLRAQLTQLAAFDGQRRDGRALVALNTALMLDAAVIVVPRGSASRAQLSILHVSSGDAAALLNPRALVVVEDGASASVLEAFVGDGVHWSNAVTELSIGRDATLDYARWLGDAGHHTGVVRARVADRGALRSVVLGLGGALARTDLHVALGEHAAATIDTLSVASGASQRDLVSVIAHERPHGHSDQLTKSIVADKATTVFDGRVFVAPNAQKTDSNQQSRALLLSRDATAVAKPQLEIYADDVKCAHGSTSGELSEAALFYFRARGVPLLEAKALLAAGFAHEVTQKLPETLSTVRVAADAAVERWLREVAR